MKSEESTSNGVKNEAESYGLLAWTPEATYKRYCSKCGEMARVIYIETTFPQKVPPKGMKLEELIITNRFNFIWVYSTCGCLHEE